MKTMRCLTVWATASGTTAALLAWLTPMLAAAFRTSSVLVSGRTPTDAFTDLLVELAAILLAGCAAWFWVVTTATVAGGLAGVDLSRLGGWAGPSVVRRAVLAACGLALAAGVATPAGAATLGSTGGSSGSSVEVVTRSMPRPTSELLVGAAVADPGPPGPSRLELLDGLPLPERAVQPGAPHQAHDAQVVVRRGDSLWSIAAASLPRASPDAHVAARWHAIYQHNRSAVGGDPDLIVPGTTLHLPAPSEESP